MNPRRATILLALAAAGVVATPAAAGAQAQRTDTALGQCAPIVHHLQIDPASGDGWVDFDQPLEFAAPDGTVVGCNPTTWTLYYEDLRGNGGLDLPASGRRPIMTPETFTVDPGGHYQRLLHAVAPPCGVQLDLVIAGEDQPYAAAVSETGDRCVDHPLGRADCSSEGGQPRFTFTLPGRTGPIHVTFGTPSGPAVFDAAPTGPSVWAVIPAVATPEQPLTVLDATVTDDEGVHQALLVDSDCYTPALPPAGDSPSSTPAADVPTANPPAGVGTGGETTGGTPPPVVAATIIDAPGPDRAALPDTGRGEGLTAIIAGCLLALGGFASLVGRWLRQQEARR